MIKYNKYIVLKTKDTQKYLNLSDRRILAILIDKVNEGRSLDGKLRNGYVVINEDEPYADEVWELIEEDEIRKGSVIDETNERRD